MNGKPINIQIDESCSIPKIDAVSKGETKINKIDNKSIVKIRPPIAIHQSPERASFA